MASNLGRLMANAPTVALTGLRSLANDPVVFGMQMARRFPDAVGTTATRLTGRGRSGAGASLLHAWLAGDMEQLEHDLRQASGSVEGLGVIGAEVATAAGLPDLVVDDVRARPIARARAAWMLGDIELALQLAPARSKYAAAVRAERAIMTPGHRLRINKVDAAPGNAVLHMLTNSLPHTQSGYTVRSHHVLQAQRGTGLNVSAITRVGYPVVVGSLGASTRDEVDGVQYERVLPKMLASRPDQRLAQQARAVAAHAAGLGTGILHTTTNYANAVVAQAVSDALGVSWTYEVRGMQEQTWVASLATAEGRERAVDSERYRLIRAREAQLAGEADAVFTLSEGMRDDLVGRGVDEGSITVVPNGISSDRLAQPIAVAADARQQLRLDRAGYWVGAVSSLVGYEGFDTLIEAVRRLRVAGTDARLLLVGDGVARPELMQQAAALGDAAVLPGRVQLERAGEYLAALDTVVVPRRDLAVTRSVAPLKPVEALAAGKPLIVSDLPPLVETIGEALAAEGCAVPPGDAGALAEAVASHAGDAALRARLSELGRARAATRTWEQLGARYAQVYDGVR